MTTLRTAVAVAMLAAFGLSAAAEARPYHHARHCTVTYVHHHKITRCR